jgi:hypothetical protein
MKLGKFYEVVVDDTNGLTGATRTVQVESYEDKGRINTKILLDGVWEDGFLFLSEIVSFKEIEKPKIKPVYRNGDTFQGLHYEYVRLNGDWYIPTLFTDDTIEETKNPNRQPGKPTTGYAINVLSEGETPKAVAAEIQTALDNREVKKVVREPQAIEQGDGDWCGR